MRALTGFYLTMMLLTLVGCAGARRPVATPAQMAQEPTSCDDLQGSEREECEWAEWYSTEREY